MHFADVKLLLNVLRSFADAGNTVLIVEHNLDFIAASDWIIELGPEGGKRGGYVIFEGTPKQLLAADTLTAKWLKVSAAI